MRDFLSITKALSDESRLRILLTTAKRLGGTGGGLRLCNLNETVQEVFEISGFSTILSVFGTTEEALQGF